MSYSKHELEIAQEMERWPSIDWESIPYEIDFEVIDKIIKLFTIYPFGTVEEIKQYRFSVLVELGLEKGLTQSSVFNFTDDDDLGAGVAGDPIRSAVYKNFDYKCHKCKKGMDEAQLNLHHRYYESKGREIPSDYILLCEDCHLKRHRESGHYELEVG